MSIRRILFWFVVAVIMYIASCGVYAADGGQMKVHMINVGNGDAALIEYNGHYALIDGGHSSNNTKKYKDGKKGNGKGLCALDKVDGDYDKNLFSFFEHFDNDMKKLTGQKATDVIIDKADEYVADFDNELDAYDRDPSSSNLTDEEIAFYEQKEDAFEEAREQMEREAYTSAPVRAFIELKDDDHLKYNKDSVLFKYYTGLGYQFIYHQTDTYMKSEDYQNGGYNDCLTYLHKKNISTIDYMILTHSHQDHVGGLSGILANDGITVKNIIWNGSSYGTGNFRVFEHEMIDRDRDRKSMVWKGDDDNQKKKENVITSFALNDKVLFTELGDTESLPAFTEEAAEDDDDLGHTVNNQSLVYRVELDGASMLFTGDAETSRQKAILSKYKNDLNVDVYKAAHHCHNNASNVNFNDAMSPYFVLTSCGTSKEPHKTARAALAGADMWLTKGNGDAIVATIAPSRFTVKNGNGKNITESPKYTHTLDYTVGASFGTPNNTKAAFAAGGKTVGALRYTTTAVRYYNPPAGSIRLTAKAGWYYDTIQRQKSAGDKGVSSSDWQKGGVTSLNGDFRGTVYYRFSNKYGKSFVRKTDGFETRGNRSSIRKGRIALAGYNSATLDWYPVKGVSKYKVWFKKGKKWKSAGTTRQLYLTARKLPAGKKVQLRVQGVGKKGYAYAYIRTLKKMAAPKVKSRGGKARVSWKKLTGAAGYQVAVNAKVLSTVKGSRSATISVTKGKKLKYKVRAYTVSNGKTIYGPWSKVKKYKI